MDYKNYKTGFVCERVVRIFEILTVQKSIKVNLLAELLNVSHVTLRKDLEYLEKRGVIRHNHGYASLEGADYTGRRIAVNHLIKRKIAAAAAQIVEENETIIIGTGSCCAMLAEELAYAKKNNTIITNSVFIANYVSSLSKIKIILLGGYFQPDSQVMVGPLAAKCAEAFYMDKYFLGVDGFNHEQGFTDRDLLQVETSQELAKRAKNVYVITDAEKFSRRGAYNMIQFDKLSGIFTDDTIPIEAEKTMIKNNVFLHKVFSVDEKVRWSQFSGHPPILYTEKEN